VSSGRELGMVDSLCQVKLRMRRRSGGLPIGHHILFTAL
jgi:hypothetical protein